MKCRSLVATAAVGIGLALADAASTAHYRAELLHPANALSSWAGGASGSQQAGAVDWDPLARHAVLWNGSADNYVDLHPAGFGYSQLEDVDGNSQVGYGTNPVTEYLDEHSILWHGTAESFVDLHPPGEMYTGEYSFALGASGASQVGYVTSLSHYQKIAFLWNGTAESGVSLKPANFFFSVALGVWGSSQVGWGDTDFHSNDQHALLWNGTAESVVDLHPAVFATTEAHDVYGTQQVGLARGPTTGFYNHALLWNGTAADYIDHHPDGFMSSEGSAILGDVQAGTGITKTTNGVEEHALVWEGSAASAVDLHQFLTPLGLNLGGSRAVGINDDGSIVGYAYDNDDIQRVRSYAIIWVPIPEPSSALLLAGGLVAALFRRRF